MTLVDGVTLVTGAWSATLAVDPDDPYFFDHPLDHVPGMALISGLFDLLRSTGTGDPERDGRQMAMSLDLRSFCELGPAVRLEAEVETVQPPADGGPGSYPDSKATVHAYQAGLAVCEGAFMFRSAPPPAPTKSTAGRSRFSRPVDQALVHRRRAENVLISDVVAGDRTRTVAVRRPPAGHLLATAPGEALRAAVLVDAARQFGILICHAEHGASPDTQFVLLRVEMDVPCGLRSDVHLRWTATPPPRGRSTLEFEVVAGDPDGEPAGRIGFDYFAATPVVYRRLRGKGRLA